MKEGIKMMKRKELRGLMMMGMNTIKDMLADGIEVFYVESHVEGGVSITDYSMDIAYTLADADGDANEYHVEDVIMAEDMRLHIDNMEFNSKLWLQAAVAKCKIEENIEKSGCTECGVFYSGRAASEFSMMHSIEEVMEIHDDAYEVCDSWYHEPFFSFEENCYMI